MIRIPIGKSALLLWMLLLAASASTACRKPDSAPGLSGSSAGDFSAWDGADRTWASTPYFKGFDMDDPFVTPVVEVEYPEWQDLFGDSKWYRFESGNLNTPLRELSPRGIKQVAGSIAAVDSGLVEGWLPAGVERCARVFRPDECSNGGGFYNPDVIVKAWFLNKGYRCRLAADFNRGKAWLAVETSGIDSMQAFEELAGKFLKEEILLSGEWRGNPPGASANTLMDISDSLQFHGGGFSCHHVQIMICSQEPIEDFGCEPVRLTEMSGYEYIVSHLVFEFPLK